MAFAIAMTAKNIESELWHDMKIFHHTGAAIQFAFVWFVHN